jgi:sortase A
MIGWIKGFNRLERVLLLAGVGCLLAFGSAMLHRYVASQIAVTKFEEAKAQASESAQQRSLDLGGEGRVDFALWSEKRVKGYLESLDLFKGAPVAILSLPRLKIRVPVFDGTDELVLNRGAGWIGGTARPGADGNIGIAGHRDGFFRPLKDAKAGDRIEVVTVSGTRIYEIEEIVIVTPKDVQVLAPRPTPSVTLVTCYPFYFVGSAPQRFIVHAGLKTETEKDSPLREPTS